MGLRAYNHLQGNTAYFYKEVTWDAATHAVSFNAAGGTFVGNSDFPNTTNYKEAGTYTLPTAIRQGCTFNGWTTLDNNTMLTGSYAVAGAVDFTASFTVDEVVETPPSIAANDVEIAWNATSGTVAYTIQDEPEPAGERGTFFLEQHLLYVVLGGSVRLSHGQQSWTVGKNEMILLRKCQSIDYVKTSDPATGLFESLLFGISGELLKDFLASQNVGPVVVTEEQGARVCPMSDRLVAYCRSLFPYFDRPENAEPALLRLKMMELLFDVMDCSKNTFRQMLQLRTPMRSDLRRVVEENITSPIGIDELSYLSGRSRSSFKREFQEIYGEPPAHWIREQRLERAYSMLKGSSMPVSEVAYTLGFENPTHFSRLFKQRYGASPSAV